MHNRPNGLLLGVDDQVRLGRGLVRVIHPGEALNLAVARTLVQTTLVRLFAVLEGSGDVDQVEITVLLNELARVFARLLKGGDWRGDDGGTGAGEFRSDKSDAANVLVAVLFGEAQLGGELRTDRLAEEHRDGAPTLLVEGDLQGAGDLVLARVHVTR